MEEHPATAAAEETDIRARTPRRRPDRFLVAGLLIALVGAAGLAADYTLPWFSFTTEMERPIVGIVNEGAPWVDQDRADLEEAYAEATFYTQGHLIWTWAGWTASIIAGLGLVVTAALARWPRTQSTSRTVLLTLHAAAVAMLLVTVSRRLGRQVIDRHYNGLEFYTWKGTIWVQGIGGMLLLATALYLLWSLRARHPPVDAADVRKPHPAALRLTVGMVALVATTMLLAPWFPVAEFQLPAIVGNQYWGESALHNLADDDPNLQTLAGQAYVGATRALFVAAGTALMAALAIAAWERAPTPRRARAWGLLAQLHLLAIAPLLLGLNSYDIYVESLSNVRRIELMSNPLVGVALWFLVLGWIHYALWVGGPYLRRWARPRARAEPEPVGESL